MPSPNPIIQPRADKSPTRSIILLAVAGFASQAQVRVMDSLLPQIASDLHTTIGLAAMVVTAYAVTHGSIQLVIGPISDRFGKYRTVALTCAIGAVLVAVCGTVSTLPQLALARLATGAAAGWIIPISMAYVGDVTPHDRLQQILGRYISGQILGQLFGQAAGGVLGDLLGWRNVFFVLAGLFALATVGLVFELAVNPQTRKHGGGGARSLLGGYAAVLTNPFARIVLIAGFLEGALAWGAFAYIGAYLHLRFGLSFSLVGGVVACFGIGSRFCDRIEAQQVERLHRPIRQRRDAQRTKFGGIAAFRNVDPSQRLGVIAMPTEPAESGCFQLRSVPAVAVHSGGG